MTGPLLRRLLCLVLLAAPAAALAPDRAVSQYQVDAWAERQGLPQASVGAIAQDHDGYLWLATQEGVARFDGVELQSYTVEDVPEIRHNFVRALHTDAAGRVWLGTHAGSLSFVAGGHFTVVEPGRRSLGPAVGISSDAGGRVFAAFGRAGLFHATGRGLEPVPAATRGTSAPVGRLIRGRSGLLWLGVTGGVVRGDATAWTFLPVAWTGGRRVSALAEDHEGNLWIACGGPEAIRLDVRSTTARPLGPPLRLPAPIRNLLYDSRGTLWIAGDDGLYRVREGASSLPERLPRPAGAVDTVAEDRDGGLWIGTHTEGLLRLRTAELTPFGVPEGLPHDMVWNVLETQDGSLWASTDGGLVRLRRGRAEEVRSARFPTSDVVALAEGRDATLWAGTFRHGVFRLRPGAAEWEGLGAAHGIPPGPVTAIFEDRRGRLWVGSREGLAVGDGHRFQPVPQTGSLYVTSLVEDAAGTVWVATYGAGLFGFAGAGVRRYGVAQGLPSEQLNALLLDSAGRLWIATNDRGLAVLDHGRIGRVGTAHGLPYALILWLVDDRRGALWMSTNHGLVRVSFADLARTAFGAQTRITTARFFDESDGLRGTGFSATGQPAGWR
ncbi:MAG TPA: hypothetical protein DD490_18710, partial [Acidobacteria bacterium]|nr:hypothetical protein [Acidobacteriota bacterium]